MYAVLVVEGSAGQEKPADSLMAERSISGRTVYTGYPLGFHRPLGVPERRPFAGLDGFVPAWFVCLRGCVLAEEARELLAAVYPTSLRAFPISSPLLCQTEL